MAKEQDFDHSADFVKKIKLYGNNDNSLVNPAKSWDISRPGPKFDWPIRFELKKIKEKTWEKYSSALASK